MRHSYPAAGSSRPQRHCNVCLEAHRAPTGATAGTKHALSAESKLAPGLADLLFSATNMYTAANDTRGAERLSGSDQQPQFSIASGHTISIDADPGASCFAGWRAVSGYAGRSATRPQLTLQTLCAEQLPPGRSRSAHRHAARLYAVTGRLRCWHMHE